MSDEMHDEPPSAAENTRTDGRVDTTADPLETLRAERDALQDRLLRTAAEFDNYRKRIDRERREQADAAASGILTELLPIVDDLDLALRAPTSGEAEAYRAGVELIHRQMQELLRRRGVTPIDALGAEFDPRFHQAVAQEPSTEYTAGQIMAELRRGYMLGERLLRPAMVKVATA
jgi:molecular chaperone GrpE